MQNIPLQAIPNQSFDIVLDNNEWTFSIKTLGSITAVSLERNGEVIMQNMRVVANELIIPYRYLEDGNFMFLTQNEELPFYTKFAVTQILVYISPTELNESRATPSLPITAADFNPAGGLPLRFAPAGYGAENIVALEDNTGYILLEGGDGYIALEGE